MAIGQKFKFRIFFFFFFFFFGELVCKISKVFCKLLNSFSYFFQAERVWHPLPPEPYLRKSVSLQYRVHIIAKTGCFVVC